jgi:outer membrane protein TolC
MLLLAAPAGSGVPGSDVPAGSAVGVRLGLAEAMRRGRERTAEVAAAAARAEAGARRADEARGYRLPVLSLEEVWMRTDAPAEAFALQLQQEVFDLTRFAASDPNHPEPVDNALTRLEVSLPLYTGGELAARVQQADLGAEAARADLAAAGDAAALAAAEAYVRLVQAREAVALLRRSRDTVARLVGRAAAYAEQGQVVRSELLRAEVELARLDDLVRSAEGGARVAEAALAFRLGEPQGLAWELEPLAGSPPAPPAQDGSAAGLDGWLATAAARPDLEAARARVRAAALEAEVARAGRLPRVGLVARYDLDDDRPFGAGGDSSSVIARASIDLYAGGRHRAAREAAAAEAEAAAAELERFEEGVRLEVRRLWEAAAAARDRHATALAALDAARETERIVGERYGQGVVGTLDLLDAVTARREAETRELDARAETVLTALELAVRAGRDPEGALPPPAVEETP